jgi:hypothetical protein
MAWLFGLALPDNLFVFIGFNSSYYGYFSLIYAFEHITFRLRKMKVDFQKKFINVSGWRRGQLRYCVCSHGS